MAILPAQDIEAIGLHLPRQHALRSDRFRAAIAAQLARLAGPLKIGRPSKNPTTGESAL